MTKAGHLVLVGRADNDQTQGETVQALDVHGLGRPVTKCELVGNEEGLDVGESVEDADTEVVEDEVVLDVGESVEDAETDAVG